jgi:hypothetical protein
MFPALALADGNPDYKVNPTAIVVGADNKATFAIRVEGAAESYEAVQFNMLLGDGIEITKVSYNLAGIASGPAKTPVDGVTLFSIRSMDKGLSGLLICTVEVSLSGNTPKRIEIMEVSQNIDAKTQDIKRNTTPTTIVVHPFGTIIDSIKYNVNITDPDYGSILANPATQEPGKQVSLTYTPSNGYGLDVWDVRDDTDKQLELTTVNDQQATFIMPDSDVTVSASTYQVGVPYNITLGSVSNGRLGSSPANQASAGQTVKVTFTPNGNYKVDSWEIKRADDNTVFAPHSEGLNTASFTMPDCAVTVSAVIIPSSQTITKYKINLSSVSNGALSSVPATESEANQVVTLTFAPNGKFIADTWTIKRLDNNGAVTNITVPYTRVNNTTARFSMPASNVTVSLTTKADDFSLGSTTTTTTTNLLTPLSGTFSGFIKGFENNTFRPESPITREQFVAILYRLKSSQPQANASSPSFADVAANRWSYNEIEWAKQCGIIEADASGNFRPAEALSRGDMAVMLVRAENLTNMAADTFTDLQGHPQSADILKAVAAGIFEGFPDKSFKPDGSTTRSQAVTALIRYCLGGEPQDAMWQGKSITFTDVASGYWAYKYIVLAVNGYGGG